MSDERTELQEGWDALAGAVAILGERFADMKSRHTADGSWEVVIPEFEPTDTKERDEHS